ncbi:hypothetical protein [Stenotrophomonas geniculata]|uniref:hypothetical protein n=1 Tax=Stenotrophomonas geniculata TaxID=86188 RepID=UPI002E75C7A6|nr:hypothetical protein [Stenotrophomonas geniculata]
MADVATLIRADLVQAGPQWLRRQGCIVADGSAQRTEKHQPTQPSNSAAYCGPRLHCFRYRQEIQHIGAQFFRPIDQAEKLSLGKFLINSFTIKPFFANGDATLDPPHLVFNMEELSFEGFVEKIAVWHKRVARNRVFADTKKINNRNELVFGERAVERFGPVIINEPMYVASRVEIHNPPLVSCSSRLQLRTVQSSHFISSVVIGHPRNRAGNGSNGPSPYSSGYRGPGRYGVPPHHAIVDTQRTATKNSIKPCHFLIPLWAGRHFATANHRKETDHG